MQAYKDSGWYHETFDYARFDGYDLIGKDGRKYLNFMTNAYLMLSVSNLLLVDRYIQGLMYNLKNCIYIDQTKKWDESMVIL